jgi:hypothetical protein
MIHVCFSESKRFLPYGVPIVCFRNMDSKNHKVESAYQCWQSSMVAKWGASMSAYVCQGIYRTDEAIKEQPGNIERRFPLYDFI